MQNHFDLLASALGENRIKKQVDISKEFSFTKTPIDIKSIYAEAFFIATSTSELIKVINLCNELDLKYLVLGSGTKVNLSRKNDCLVIKNRSSQIKIFGIKGKISREGIGIEQAFLEVDSGVFLEKVAAFSKNQGLSGFEKLEGQTGTVGGSLLENNTLTSKFHQVKLLSPAGKILTRGDLSFQKDHVILSVLFKLKARGFE